MAKPDGSMQTLVHISDLHIGRDEATDQSARRLARMLVEARVDRVLLTGDVTHRGLASEFARYERIFAPLLEAGRLVAVPGNHDRMGDDAARGLMRGGRVAVTSSAGLHVVRVDSTAPHNRSLIDGHGSLSTQDVADVRLALDEAPPGDLPVVMLHHHVLPLPVEDLAERLATLVGLPCADELPLGEDLLGQILGRCRLVLHGHRHVPAEFRVAVPATSPLRILNAGSSTILGKARIIAHAGGELAWEGWLAVESVAPRAWKPSPGAFRPDAVVVA
ncbi:MAG: metallophosphoesterase, partial [Deltaproteobacteria bacterium]